MYIDFRKSVLLFLTSYALFFPLHAQDNTALQGLYGLYKGTLPCADCPGINYRISLKPDSTFEESSFYMERSDSVMTGSGTFYIQDHSILRLNGSKFTTGIFNVQSSSLQMLDRNGNEITGELAAYYLLKKVTRSKKNITGEEAGIRTVSIDRKKFSQGITFYATGNEPSWSLDIRKNDNISFTTLEGLTLEVPYAKGVKAADAIVTLYHSQTTSGDLKMQTQQMTCIDNMSGVPAHYKVTVDIKYAGDSEYRHFEGCGNEVPDFNLEGRWYLHLPPSNGQDDSSQQHLPYIEINLDSFSYAGFTGCNRMTGKIISLERGAIRFETSAITMMACPDMHQESTFLQALQSTTQYKLNGDVLTFSNPDKATHNMSRAIQIGDMKQRLIDIWVLESIQGKKAEQKDYRIDLPRLEVNSQLNFTGTTGCNNISGTIIADDQTIQVIIQKMTRMACNNATMEAAFVDALTNVNTWNIAANQLTMLKDDSVQLVFRKVD